MINILLNSIWYPVCMSITLEDSIKDFLENVPFIDNINTKHKKTV